jgi:hypothetical protein
MELFNDCVEANNLGGLENLITKNDFGEKSSRSNLSIFGLFERMRIFKQIGLNKSRKCGLMKEEKITPPRIHI